MKRTEEKCRVRDLETVIIWAVFLLLVHTFWPSRVWIPLCAAVLLTGLLLKGTASRMVRGWLKFSVTLSRTNSRVILTLVFFFFLTPLALLYRMFARNPLMLKKDKGASTYFHERNHSFERGDFEKMW
jgi:hypothetical protein